MMYIAKLKFVP